MIKYFGVNEINLKSALEGTSTVFFHKKDSLQSIPLEKVAICFLFS